MPDEYLFPRVVLHAAMFRMGCNYNEQTEGEQTNMNCPKCRTPSLNHFAVQEISVDRCSSCDGIWFDAHELSRLLAEDARQVASLRRGSVREEVAGKQGLCPRDGSELLRVYSAIDRSVILDACAECRGIWLDGGEFQKLFAASKA
jgi:Zn-finger nucleic acid-binding protein